MFLYYSIFFLIGIYALQTVWLIIYAGLFPSFVDNLIYAVTWIIVYPFSAFMMVKCLIKNSSNIKLLKWFSFMWFIATFWSGWFFLLDRPDDYGAAALFSFHILYAYPYLRLAFWGVAGLLLLPIVPLFNLTLFLIAWKKPQWFYKQEAQLKT
ncbi:hypothetical protein [Maridesulfovibrio frigidus]|uniref:hypothetical protein n=1 Tax=Maridesulfovibrio frigidus TaxID=340956 RepID=UPI0004E17E3E|nr:hypothetical protein [Maridesulfovibrio frigidus]